MRVPVVSAMMASYPEEESTYSVNKQTTRKGEYVHQDPLVAQHELLVTEIESSEGHLGTTLRSVYDAANPAQFLQQLDARIRSHDKEIERMCNYHYQGFIESIRGLLQVRTDAVNLKREISWTNQQLQKSGLGLMARGQQLVRQRKIQGNIDAAIETMTLCLPVLEVYGKLREQMASKRYYPALKTLEQLEHTYLPRLSDYRFSQPMCETIPRLRENIKEASMLDLRDFLENIRKHSHRIGQTAMKHAAELACMDVNLVMRKAAKRHAPPPPNPFTGAPDDDPHGANPFDDDDDAAELDVEEGMSAQDLIDFSPVYRCLHIYCVLGDREVFESYYRKQRRKQARLALQPPQTMERAKRLVQAQGVDPAPQQTLEGYKKYFHDIIGFFVVEDHILSTTSGLVSRAYIDELWDMALSKVVAVLRTHIGFCTDPSLMLQIKNLVMLFCLTLRGYGFTVSQLYELLLEIRDQYSEILMQKWVGVFNTIFDEDNYTPIVVETERDYVDITQKFPFTDAQLEQDCFPKWLPFSHFVPRVYGQVKEYIYACLKFSEDLHLSQTEIDDMIRKLANVLLTRTLGGCLSELIKLPHLSLLQLIQISINMNYLEQSCVYLEEFISNITGAEKDVHVCKLQGTSMFKDARSEAEAQIYKQINEKTNEFFELAEYDWMLAEPLGHASDYVIDLITFLRSTFLSFTNLPEKVAQTACMSACKHISQLMLQFLTENEVKAISMAALHQFNLDLVQCEQFASSEPVPGLNDGTLQLAFVDLRQLIDLFMAWDWPNYISDFGKSYSKYIRVKPDTCIVLLEKMKDADKKKNNLFATFKRNERDKKKLLDTVLKQLRQLTNGHASAH